MMGIFIVWQIGFLLAYNAMSMLDEAIDRRTEAEFLEKNTFRTVFSAFDWRLNDLSARP